MALSIIHTKIVSLALLLHMDLCMPWSFTKSYDAFSFFIADYCYFHFHLSPLLLPSAQNAEAFAFAFVSSSSFHSSAFEIRQLSSLCYPHFPVFFFFDSYEFCFYFVPREGGFSILIDTIRGWEMLIRIRRKRIRNLTKGSPCVDFLSISVVIICSLQCVGREGSFSVT